MKAVYIITTLGVLALSSLSAAHAYTEIECSTDPVFAANACNQCFDGGAKGEGANLGLLQDEWVNTSQVDKIIYKEEQEMPRMIELDTASVSWKQTPGSAGFWEYTQELNALYDSGEEGYILPKGQRVVWLKSKLGYAYHLQRNKAQEGKNIGLLVYPLFTHNISENGDVSVESQEHRECVLFKSGAPEQKNEVHTGERPEKSQTLPKTGPEHYLLLLFAAIIGGVSFMKLRKKD